MVTFFLVGLQRCNGELLNNSQDQAYEQGPDLWLTSVYGPMIDVEKLAFLIKLREIRQSRSGLWLLSGDFNMIYRAEDKSNDRLDRRQMGQFHRFLNDVVLKEIHLNG
jgi:hypothetical protein